MNNQKIIEEFHSTLIKQGWSLEERQNPLDGNQNVEKSPLNLKEIEDIFFGLSKGDLSVELNLLKNQYLKDKKNLGTGCKKCEFNALVNKYKKRVAEFYSHS